MEILKEILRIVTSKSDISKVLPELDPESPEEIRGSLSGRFLNGLSSDSYLTDTDASKDLYKSDQTDQRYRTLKSRTYERLLHSLLFLQVKQPEHSEYLSYYYKCTRNLICAQSLMRFASRKAGFAVSQKTLLIAQKYEFTDICLTLAVLLRETSAFWGQRKKFDYYDGLGSKYLKILEAEYRTNALLDKYSLEMIATSRTKQYLLQLAESVKNEIDDLVKLYGSHLLKLNKVRIDIAVASQLNDFQMIIEVCDAAIEYLAANKHLSQPARLGEFRLRKMISQINVRQYHAAFQSADTVVDSFQEAGNNWFIALYYATCAAFLSENYSRADYYISTATRHKRFSLADESTRESRVIFGAYAHLAELLGLYIPEPQYSNRSFRLSTYLNSIPLESKIKKISNILILLSHVAFLILEGNFDLVEKRLEYLRVYISRYLTEKQFSRVRLFVKLLQTFPKHSFIAKDIRKANHELYELLLLSKTDNITTEIIEYIQYEILYESLLIFLEKHAAAIKVD
ncbi:MAG: hypothetical protein HYX66_05830 [Ignavibacteria bacterium]|nr:hypothetical protein [Ignavibacteria bacterium]